MEEFSSEKGRYSGDAGTAGIFTKARKLPEHVLSAIIRRLISNWSKEITESRNGLLQRTQRNAEEIQKESGLKRKIVSGYVFQ